MLTDFFNTKYYLWMVKYTARVKSDVNEKDNLITTRNHFRCKKFYLIQLVVNKIQDHPSVMHVLN